jgi:hypothetical protein
MKPLYVINDLHLSAIRAGGTTPQTAWQLRQDLLKGLESMLDVIDSDVAVNGDFADSYRMVPADMLAAYYIFCKWLDRGHKVYALPGNHCLSKSSFDLSSFEMLFRFLAAQYPEQIVLMMEPGALRDGIYAIPHVQNQSLLDLELGRVPAGTDYLLLHANFSNEFAQHSDHSLDVSEAQIDALDIKHAIFGHVHQQSTAMGGKVVIVGNQMCSSISDCLGNATKRMAKITDAGIEFIQTWEAEGDYQEIDWRELEDTGARFIRAVGIATNAEAAQVVQAISRFRQKSSALIVGNAVKVEGINDQAELELSHEAITGFNVHEALAKLLTPEENEKINKLLESEHD